MRQLTPKIDSPIPTIPSTIQPVQSRPCLPAVRTLIVGVVVLAGSMVGNVCSVVVVVEEELVVVVVDRDDVVVVDLDVEVVGIRSTSKLASAVADAPTARKAAE